LLGLALALLLVAGAPGADIRSAARALAPPRAHIVVAQDRGAEFGVVSFDDGAHASAVALHWRNRRWSRAAAGPIRIAVAATRPTRGRVYLEAHVRASTTVAGDLGLWLDARPLEAASFPGRGRAVVTAVATGLRPGRHVVTLFVAAGDFATARAWSFRSR
jgi:hypothetical protein